MVVRSSAAIRREFISGLALTVASVGMASLMATASPVQAQELSLDKNATANDLKDPEKMRQRASTATRGYYDAMIKADYEAAATFVHPDLAGSLKKGMGDAIRKLAPGTQKKAVEKLGLKSLDEYDGLSLERFFVLWAKSDYAFAAATLANKEVAATYRIEGVVCEIGVACDVTVDVRGRNEGGEINSSRSMIRVAPVDGAWRVGANVTVKAIDPALYKGPKRRKAQRERMEKAAKENAGK